MSRLRLWRQSAVVLAVLLSAASAYAYRPFGTEDAGVAGRGAAQAEIGFDYLHWQNGMLERNYLLTPIYGLTDNFEVSVEIPYLVHQNPDGTAPSGPGDINIVGKYLLVPGETAYALKGVVKLDNGNFSQGLGSGDKDYSLFAVVSSRIGSVIVHSHLGYTWIGKAQIRTLRDIFLYGLAFDCPLTERWRIAAEINGNRHPDSRVTDDPRNWLAGLIYKVSEKADFDFALRGGLSSSSPQWDVTTGLSATL